MRVIPDICVVTHPLSSSGENATRSLLAILAAITNVSLVTADLPGDSTIRDNYDHVEISRVGVGSNITVAAARFALNQLRMCYELGRRDEEVVLFFGATSYLLPIAFARALGRTVIVEPRGDVPLTLRLTWEERVPTTLARVLSGTVRALERAGFRLADAIVTYTPGMAAQLRLAPFEHKLYTQGARFVDTEQFSPMTPFEERDTAVGFLGRLDEEKGIEELAEVARQLTAPTRPVDVSSGSLDSTDGVRFRFVGDGDLRGWLERELAGEISSGRVELTGWVDHDRVPEELSDLRLLIMPSQPTEGLPTTILESLSCGTPVYVTPVSGIPDVVRAGETGFFMQNREPESIVRDVKSILRRDDLREISENGRALIQAEYSLEAAVHRYRTMLEEIAA